MDEMLDVVDENNRVIGTDKRSVISKKNLLRRAVALLVLRGDDEVLLEMRPHDKDINPDCWSFSVCGHLKSGESHDAAMKRETKEELGKDIDAEYVRLFRPEREYRGYFIYVYIARLKENSRMEFDMRESTKARFWKKSEILEKHDGKEKFSPHFLWVFRWMVENGKI